MVKTNYGENYDQTMHKKVVVNFDFRANREVAEDSFICEAEWMDGGGHLVSASGTTYEEAKTKALQMLDANGISDCSILTSERDEAIKAKERAEAVIKSIREAVKDGPVNFWNDREGLYTDTKIVQEALCYYDKDNPNE